MSYASSAHIAVLDGTVLDLSGDVVDVTGTAWFWTGERDDRGWQLMQSRQPASHRSHIEKPLPLDLVYAERGPLIPATAPTTAAARRAAWTAPSPRHLAQLLNTPKEIHR
ncbi:MAG TPA: phiSA1p31-related protein [Streptomyces sp.]|nr:phiSA1p31-related protein [Streptomyces sp.]